MDEAEYRSGNLAMRTYVGKLERNSLFLESQLGREVSEVAELQHKLEMTRRVIKRLDEVSQSDWKRIKDLEAEKKQLREALNKGSRQLVEACKTIADLDDERIRLREALEKYGRHMMRCYLRVGSLNPGMRDIKCDCGLDEFLNKADTNSQEADNG